MVVPTLRAHLDLTGVVVIGDALQTQRDLSIQIVEAGGDYVWFVKDNQARLRSDIEQLFIPLAPLPGTSEPPSDVTIARQVTKGHGRLEEHRIMVSSELQEYSDWPYLAQVFKLERWVREGDGRERVEVQYGVTSLARSDADAQRLLTITRAEWGIENGLHYRRDVTLQEDAGQVRRGGAPQVMAALNNAVIGIVQQAGEHNLAAAQRCFAYHFDRLLTRIAAEPLSPDFA